MMAAGFSSDAFYCAARVDLAALDKTRLRLHVHARLLRAADRARFDAQAHEHAEHALLVELGALALVRQEIARFYEQGSGDRVSAIRPLVRIAPPDIDDAPLAMTGSSRSVDRRGE